MLKQPAAGLDQAVILRTRDKRHLVRIAESHVQAVIYEPRSLPSWLSELAIAVESGAFVVPRTNLSGLTAGEIETWLAGHLSDGGLTPYVRIALTDDILSLTALLANIANVSRFMLRIFTAVPTTDCGFHVDTVPNGSPPWGLLRAYNGAGTAFVEPDNVTSFAEFYRYLGRRERMERELCEARASGDVPIIEYIEREKLRLDEERSFLERPDEVHFVPAGSVVAFKHIDVSQHWTAHAKVKAWIHCSPMSGPSRLVVNVTSPEQVQRRRR